MTKTERRCLELLASGKTEAEIGQALTLSASEVDAILSVGMRKLGVGNRIAAVAKAGRLGLLET
ncbi:helix-turn-helix domain-containing protein [Pseudohoeflea coraliihabitans]|uniref:Helix-turn-helix transcriptional regulator n=1 Tax=Pseudohoeflea coraliihabitans TaxID=2860393 RepID=A0ABS6WPL3_9HYPH|nr:helix-turn-helix transcriptional regulator [Pseudohoeflea sp. DP4N28-3]MBW3097909.1 helix-turn-helix transcriptional regulator [Pseudohoeflea sp. DP4N28-3]